MTCHHYCTDPMVCIECIRRFWKWAENHTRGRRNKLWNGLSFYECASKHKKQNASHPVKDERRLTRSPRLTGGVVRWSWPCNVVRVRV